MLTILEYILDLHLLNNIGIDLNTASHRASINMRWDWQLNVGRSEKQETLFVLREKRIKSPRKFICLICSFLLYWAGVQHQDLIPQVERDSEGCAVAVWSTDSQR